MKQKSSLHSPGRWAVAVAAMCSVAMVPVVFAGTLPTDPTEILPGTVTAGTGGDTIELLISWGVRLLAYAIMIIAALGSGWFIFQAFARQQPQKWMGKIRRRGCWQSHYGRSGCDNRPNCSGMGCWLGRWHKLIREWSWKM